MALPQNNTSQENPWVAPWQDQGGWVSIKENTPQIWEAYSQTYDQTPNTQQNPDYTEIEWQVSNTQQQQPTQVQPTVENPQIWTAFSTEKQQPAKAWSKTWKNEQIKAEQEAKKDYDKNKDGILKQLSSELSDELMSLWKAGTKLDERTKNLAMRQVMEKFRGQIPDQEIVDAIRNIDSTVLGDNGIKTWWEYFQRSNKVYNKANSLRNTSSNELAKWIQTGLISNDEMDSLKNIDPAKYDEVYKLKNEIDKSEQRNNTLNWEVDPQKDIEKTSVDNFVTREWLDKVSLANNLWWKKNMLAIYDSMVNTDWVNKAQEEVNWLGVKITKLEREKSKLEETLTKEYETSLSKTALSFLIQDRQKPMNEELIDLRLEMDWKARTLNSMKQENEKRFSIYSQEQKQLKEEERRNMQRKYKTQMDKYNMNRQMNMDQWNKYKDQIQMKRNSEDRDYMKNKPTQDQLLASLEWENWSLLANKMRKLELDRWKPVFSFQNPDWTISIYEKGLNWWINVVDNYTPLSPEQKEIKMTQVSYMKSRIGTPYERGWTWTTDKWGVDCSGLIMLAWQMSWALKPWTDMTASGMYNQPAKDRELTNMQEWDLLYFRDNKTWKITHVASALGSLQNGKLKVIDASGKKWVSERTLNVWPDWSWAWYTILGKENFTIASMQPQQSQAPEQIQTTAVKSLSNNAQNILFGMDLKDLPTWDRSETVTQLRNYFDNVKDQYSDPTLYKIDKSVINSKELDSQVKKKLGSINSVRGQLEWLERSLEWKDTWPLVWLMEKTIDKRTDQDMAEFNAQVQALIPWLARWVFGEVWVLTDNDIKNYMKTIPNLSTRSDKNQAITNNLKELLKNSFVDTIRTQANWWVNVSRFADDYKFWTTTYDTGKQKDPYSIYVNTKPTASQKLNEYGI